MVKDFREETMRSGISNLMMESGGSRLQQTLKEAIKQALEIKRRERGG